MEDEQTIPEEVTTEEVLEVATEETPEVEAPAETIEETNTETLEEKTPEELAKHNFEGAERRHKFKAEKQRRETAEQELQHLKEQIARNNAPAQPQPAISRDPNAPSIETFNGDTDQYVEAMIEYKAEQRTKQNATQSLVKGFDDLEKEYMKANLSYQDDITYSTAPKPSPLVAKAILKSEVGPQVLHELVKDPQLAAKLNRMDDIDVLKELIKIEDKAKVKPAVSSAPTPISSPKTSSPVGSKKISENGSQADYNRKMSHYRAHGEWPQ